MKNVKALNVTLVHQNLFLIKNGFYLAFNDKSTASEVTKFVNAYEVSDNPIITGGYSQELQAAITFVELRVNASSRFWIGATSNGDVGCRNRWDVTYKKHGMDRMAPVYKTHSVDFRVKMEKELIEYFLRQFPNNCQNVKGGGGGPTGDPPYIIYVVWKQ